jgi:hypothetical protein
MGIYIYIKLRKWVSRKRTEPESLDSLSLIDCRGQKLIRPRIVRLDTLGTFAGKINSSNLCRICVMTEKKL